MARHSGKTIVDRAAEFLSSKGDCTPAELNDHLAVGNYASNYVLYMKIAGHSVDTVKNGRTVVKYVYVSAPADAAVKAAAKAAQKAVQEAVKQAKPVKAKSVKTVVIDDDTPVMDRGRKSRKSVDDVESTFGSSGSIGSYSVDADWDTVPSNIKPRDLGV